MSTTRDDQHLQLLAIFHYVLAGLMTLGGCVPVIHVTLGILMIAGALPPDNSGEIPPAFLGWFFVTLGCGFMAMGWALAAAIAFGGWSLQRRRRWLACVVIAALQCLIMPLGTILGVFTIVVLNRPGVKDQFSSTSPGDQHRQTTGLG